MYFPVILNVIFFFFVCFSFQEKKNTFALNAKSNNCQHKDEHAIMILVILIVSYNHSRQFLHDHYFHLVSRLMTPKKGTRLPILDLAIFLEKKTSLNLPADKWPGTASINLVGPIPRCFPDEGAPAVGLAN